jgi:hypothetical protein
VKELQRVKIEYDVMVVVDDKKDVADVIDKELKKILRNEEPNYEFFGVVENLDEYDVDWYDAIPYGDSGDKPCQYFVTDAIKEREVVEKVKGMLSEQDWEALVRQLKDG